jgi:GxxExxY protein
LKDLTNLYKDITGKVIGCAMKVHTTLGNGFPEVIYQRALSVEMRHEDISFVREFEMPVFYRDEKTGDRRVDFLVEECVSVEIKAVKDLEPSHLAQGKNYLEAYKLEIGLLINFGAPSLQYKRLLNNKVKKKVVPKI